MCNPRICTVHACAPSSASCSLGALIRLSLPLLGSMAHGAVRMVDACLAAQAVAQLGQLATAFSDATRFGCVLDTLAGGLTGGYFNVSLTAINDADHRGDAFLGFVENPLLDVATV